MSWLLWLVLQWTWKHKYLLEIRVLFPLDIFSKLGLCDSSIFNFLRNLHTVYHSRLYFHQRCTRIPLSSHSNTYLLSLVFFIISILMGTRWYLIVVLIYISLMINGVEQLFMCRWPFICLFLKNIYSGSLPVFKLYSVLLLSCLHFLHY